MTKREIATFHKNYDYMWSKLSTTYYHVKEETNKAKHITGKSYLPAYSICSKCNSDKNFAPSKQTVDSIVQFYNCNLSPEVSTKQFISEDLSITDNIRYKTKTIFDQRFIGTFYGYYPTASPSEEILGSVMKIYEEDNTLKAIYISGIRSDDELYGQDLADLLAHEPPRKNHFDDYFNSRSRENQRCSFYEGTVELTASSLLIVFRTPSLYKKLVFTFNIDCFPSNNGKPYLGGLAFALATSDRTFDARFFQIGFINSQTGSISINHPALASSFQFDSGKQVALTSGTDRIWYEFILKHVVSHHAPEPEIL